MTTQPQVLSVRRRTGAVDLDLHVPADLAWFPAHFPRFAMLPGVVQVDWAITLAREHLASSGTFRKLAGLKFQRPILPGANVTLSLESPAAGGIAFAYRFAELTCSLGRIEFARSR